MEQKLKSIRDHRGQIPPVRQWLLRKLFFDSNFEILMISTNTFGGNTVSSSHAPLN